MIRTQRGENIIKKAEKQLLYERIKNINYTLKCHEHDRYMYKNELKDLLEQEQDQEIWNACIEEIEKRKELRHQQVMKRQIRKFNNLLIKEKQNQRGGCSKHQSDRSKIQGPGNKDESLNSNKNQERTKKWVVNLSSIPLIKPKKISWHMVLILQLCHRNPPWGIHNIH